MFTDDGKYAKDFVELRFACLGCHIDKDVAWAAQHAKGVHSLGK
jgi:nitrate reductase cytochrome c-type subunit